MDNIEEGENGRAKSCWVDRKPNKNTAVPVKKRGAKNRATKPVCRGSFPYERCHAQCTNRFSVPSSSATCPAWSPSGAKRSHSPLGGCSRKKQPTAGTRGPAAHTPGVAVGTRSRTGSRGLTSGSRGPPAAREGTA